MQPHSRPDALIVREWCLGLPLAEERELSSEERAEFWRAARRYRLLCWVWGCAFPILAVAALAAAVSSSRAGFWACLILLVAAVCALLWASENDRQLRRFKQDARVGSVKVFHGPARLLRGHGLPLQDFGAAQVTMEVGASNHVLSLNGRAVSGLHRVSTAVAAQAIPQVLGAGEAASARPLTPGERDELRVLARRHVRTAFWPALFVGAVVTLLGALTWQAQAAGSASRPLLEPFGIGLLAVSAALSWKLQRAWKQSQQMHEDARRGEVQVVAPAVRVSIEAASAGPSTWNVPMPAAREVLPLCGRAWTVAGVAAAWRSGEDA